MGNKLLCIVVIISAFVGVACNVCNGIPNASFRGGRETVTPDMDSIQVEDTLIYRSIIPFNLIYGDSSVINYSGASNVATDINLTTISGLNMAYGAVDSFYIFPITGTIKNNPKALDASKTINFIQGDTSYNFSMGISPLKRGIYALTVISIYQAQKNCTNAGIEIDFENTNQHLHYLQDIYLGGGAIDPQSQTSTYCFKVY